jgi:hypothetical protein
MPVDKIRNPRPGPGGRRPGAGRPRDPESLQGLRRRKLRLEIEDLELDLAAKRKALVDVEQAATVVAAAFTACRSRLLALPPKVAPMVVALTDVEDVRRLLADALEEALEELSTDATSLGA